MAESVIVRKATTTQVTVRGKDNPDIIVNDPAPGGGGSGAAAFIPITTAELNAMAGAGTMTVGRSYLLTDVSEVAVVLTIYNYLRISGDIYYGSDAASITSANPSGSYNENIAIGGTLTADETVTWGVIGADASYVTVNPTTGVWSLASTNYETKTSYTFIFTATDADTNVTSQTVNITITNVLEVTLGALGGTFTLPENAAAGATAGTLTGMTSGSTLSLFDNAGGRVALSGNNIVRGATGLNYEAATSHSFTVRETHPDGNNSPRDTVRTLNVTNIYEQPNLVTLTLDDSSVPEDSAVTINIVGAKAGSTLAVTSGSLPTGMTLNSAARTISGTPTTIGSYAFQITETLADSANSPLATSLNISVTATGTILSAPLIALTSATPTTYPPTISVELYADHEVGDELRIQTATAYSFASPVVNTTITLTSNMATNASLIASALSAITTPTVSFIRCRVERTGATSSWSNVVKHGTSAVPTITSPGTLTNLSGYEGTVWSQAIVLSETAFLTLTGNDMINFEIEGAQPGTNFTLKFMDDTVQDYETPMDFNMNHIFDIGLVVTGLNGVSATNTTNVEVLFYDTTPDAFTFTDDAAVATSSTQTSTLTAVLAGMAVGYAAPISLTGTWNRFRIHNGTSWGSWLTSTTGVTVQNGYNVEVEIVASASYSTALTATLTIGGVSDGYTVTTQADPASASIIANTSPPTPIWAEYWFTTITFEDVSFPATGLGILDVFSGRSITNVTVGGVDADQIASESTGYTRWQTDSALTAGTYDVVITMPTGSDQWISILNFCLLNATPTPTVTGSLSAGYRADPQVMASPTIPAGGVCLASFLDGDAANPATWSTGNVELVDVAPSGPTKRLTAAYRTTTGEISLSGDPTPWSYHWVGGLYSVWDNA